MYVVEYIRRGERVSLAIAKVNEVFTTVTLLEDSKDVSAWKIRDISNLYIAFGWGQGEFKKFRSNGFTNEDYKHVY